ncbi:MAG: 4Fe-4S dicluster domain-containing protein [Saccharolobus sp.]
MHEIYTVLKHTKIGNFKVKNLIKYNDGLDIPANAKPRYEYFRGVESETIVDFTDYKGIEDLGDRIKVKAGTKWEDVIKNYNVEFWSNLDFTVGGSVFFNDPITGFNEFGKIASRVDVDAILDGKYYSGKYKGGIVINVYLKKESKENIYKKYYGELPDIISIIKNWYSIRIPVFRDISIVKEENNESYILVSYPKSREILVADLIYGFETENKIKYEHLNYKYWYFGYLPISELDSIIDLINNSERSIIRFRKDEISYSIYSNKPLGSIKNALDYSTTENESLFKGCILCGKCIEVCPYGKQNNDIEHTPLGFYVISYFNKDNDLANCHMCGLCEEVCPVSLNITDDLRKSAKLNQILPRNTIRINKEYTSVLLITSLSETFFEYIIKAIVYLLKKGKKIGIIYLPYDFSKIVKNEVDLKELEKVKEIYVITPEEYFYLQKLKKKRTIDIYNLQLMILEDLKLNMNDVHIPCLMRNEIKSDIICSNVFLNMLNNRNNIRKVEKKITLCPLTAKALNIMTPMDLLNITINEEYVDSFIERLDKNLSVIKDIEEDISWYDGIDDNIKNELYSKIIESTIKNEKIEDLVLLYFKLDSINKISASAKKFLLSTLDKIIFP